MPAPWRQIFPFSKIHQMPVPWGVRVAGAGQSTLLTLIHFRFICKILIIYNILQRFYSIAILAMISFVWFSRSGSGVYREQLQKDCVKFNVALQRIQQRIKQILRNEAPAILALGMMTTCKIC